MAQRPCVMSICAEHGFNHVAGYYDKCFECALEIFVSESTVNVVQKDYSDHDLRVYCFKCGHAQLEKEKPERAPLSQEQIDEIKRGLAL